MNTSLHGQKNQQLTMLTPAASSHLGLPLLGGNPGTDRVAQELQLSAQP
tara:strand:+ start:312 stop:458 length:147 start_codon:yes stop_codon:yes gene_type:complete